MGYLNAVKNLFEKFEDISSDFEVIKLTTGHINSTYLIINQKKKFILQQINSSIFKQTEVLTQNVIEISNHLKKKNYPHKILKQFAFKNGEYLYENSWRILEFIENSQSFEKVKSAQQAFEAAKFLSEFYFYINDLDTDLIKDSIPGFLDFDSRFEQFENALKSAEFQRTENSRNEIEFIVQNQKLLKVWNEISVKIPNRIIHADPKISNFLFDQNSDEKIIGLIDWDTFMKGPVLYDFGDMVRSYTNLKNEDDDSDGATFSLKNYNALKNGFLSYLKSELTPIEIENLDLAAKIVIYIQAVRFLTDYLNGDLYYQISYSEQNLNRTKNQINLLKELTEAL